MTMKAVLFQGEGQVEVKEVPRPVLEEPTDALVRVTTSSICGTDLHFLHGQLPMRPGTIMGHEFVGIVEEVGPGVTSFRPGDRVAVSCLIRCGRCPFCLAGHFSQCEEGGMLYGVTVNGAQAEYVRVPYAENGMYPIPPDLKDEDVIFAGDILSTGYFGAELGGIKPGDTVAILGVGPVGLCTIAAVRLFGPSQIIAVGRKDRSRVEKALEMGADRAVLSTEEDPVDAIYSATDGRGADVVIECAGNPKSFALALEVVRNAGQMVLTGLYTGPIKLPLHQVFLRNLKLAWGLVDTTHVPQLLKLIQHGKINTRPLITHILPLEEAEKAYQILDNREEGVLKVILKAPE